LHSSDSATFRGIDHVQLAAPPGCEAEARRFFGGPVGQSPRVRRVADRRVSVVLSALRLMARLVHATAEIGAISVVLLLGACARPSHATPASLATDGRAGASTNAAPSDGEPPASWRASDAGDRGEAAAQGDESGHRADAVAPPLGPLSNDRKSVSAFLCGGRALCRVDKVTAMPSSPGAFRALVHVRLGAPFRQGDDPSTVYNEEWLVAAPRGGRLTRRLLVGTGGEQGEGIPVPEFTIHGSRLSYFLGSGMAPSNWAGDHAAELDLDPPERASETWHDFNRFSACDQEETTWTRVRPWKAVTWSRELCPGPPPVPGPFREVTDPAGQQVRCLDLAYDEIPNVRVDGSFVTDDWKTVTLGACAVDVDGSRGHGFVTFGKTRGRNDASFRAVLVGHVLFVQVHDDVLTGASERWVDDDHVELWVASEADIVGAACDLEKTEADRQAALAAKQWGIRAADGRVFPGAGAPTAALKAERAQVDSHTVRFRIELPEDFEALTVVYSDSDDGKTQKSLLATSRLSFAVGSTLGRVDRTPASRTTCAVVDGSLEPDGQREADPECPLVAEGELPAGCQ
jgi:hypothetical protein